MGSRVYVPPSDDTLFMRGFSYHHRPEQIKEFFGKEAGRCGVEFNKDDGNDGQYIALRFESRDVAKDVYRRFNDTDILGDRVTMTWYKDLRRVKQMHDPRRYSGAMGRGGHYDYHEGRGRDSYHQFRRSSGGRGRHHYDSHPDRMRRLSRSISRSRSSASINSRSASSTGSYESGEVHKRRGSRSSSQDHKKSSKRRRRHDESSQSTERKRMKRMRRMRKMMRRQPEDGQIMDHKPSDKEDNVISIEAEDHIIDISNDFSAKATSVVKELDPVKEADKNVTIDNNDDKADNVAKDNNSQETSFNLAASDNQPLKARSAETDKMLGVEDVEEDEGEMVENGECNDVVEKAVATKEYQLRQQRQASSNEERIRVLKEKKAQVEKAYRQDCETIVMVTKLLISKDPELEDRLQKSLRENLRDIGHRCIQELRDHVDRIKQ